MPSAEITSATKLALKASRVALPSPPTLEKGVLSVKAICTPTSTLDAFTEQLGALPLNPTAHTPQLGPVCPTSQTQAPPEHVPAPPHEAAREHGDGEGEKVGVAVPDAVPEEVKEAAADAEEVGVATADVEDEGEGVAEAVWVGLNAVSVSVRPMRPCVPYRDCTISACRRTLPVPAAGAVQDMDMELLSELLTCVKALGQPLARTFESEEEKDPTFV